MLTCYIKHCNSLLPIVMITLHYKLMCVCTLDCKSPLSSQILELGCLTAVHYHYGVLIMWYPYVTNYDGMGSGTNHMIEMEETCREKRVKSGSWEVPIVHTHDLYVPPRPHSMHKYM